eukprot:m.198621 g.198621  ORF g.198621 m.198621 type:complete len:309 (+) comp17676_c0_seq6:41-967(+)
MAEQLADEHMDKRKKDREVGDKMEADGSIESPLQRMCFVKPPSPTPERTSSLPCTDVPVNDDDFARGESRSDYIAEAFDDDYALMNNKSTEFAEPAKNVCRLEDERGRLHGTGFVLQEGKRKVVVTSRIVVDRLKNQTIFANFTPNPDQTSPSKGERYELKKLDAQGSADANVAVLQSDDIEDDIGRPGLRLREENKSIKSSEDCCLFGYPATADGGSHCSRYPGLLFGILRFSRAGTVLYIDKNNDQFHHSSFVLETSVGSPVLDEHGRVIGMHQNEIRADRSLATSFNKIRESVEAAFQGQVQLHL